MYISRSMTTDPTCVRPETPLPEARELLEARRLRHLPVTDAAGRLVGMLSDRDVRSAFPSTVLNPRVRADQIDRLEKVSAGDIMSRPPVALPQEATIDDALLLFARHRVGALPVTDADGRVVGIVTKGDVLRAYGRLFGIGVAGSSLVEVVDDGAPRLLSRIAQALDAHGFPCTRIVRVDAAGGAAGEAYVRVQSYNIHAVHEALRAAGLETVPHKTPGR
jgi:acetoin utilization protein AcuB